MLNENNNLIDLSKIKLGLDKCVNYQNNSSSEYLYNLVLKKHKDYELKQLLDSDEFYILLYATLDSWGMNSRGAKLIELDLFIKNIKQNKNLFLELEKYNLSNIDVDELNQLLDTKIALLYKNTKIINSRQTNLFVKDPLVVNSKLFHFILPKLFVPMDRKYTMSYFYRTVNTNYMRFKEVMRFNLKFLTDYNKNNDLLDKFQNKFRYELYPSKLFDNVIIGLHNMKTE